MWRTSLSSIVPERREGSVWFAVGQRTAVKAGVGDEYDADLLRRDFPAVCALDVRF